MSSETARRDDNDIPVIMGITDDASQERRMLRVDPTTGRLLVSASGSSSSGFQSPLTGAVDGSNRTFTWTTAPNAISVDNQVMQKVSQNGDVNWVGTTSTLLTVAPTQSVFAVA